MAIAQPIFRAIPIPWQMAIFFFICWKGRLVLSGISSSDFTILIDSGNESGRIKVFSA
jgi:hypothetical protein